MLASKIGISIHFSVGVGVCTYIPRTNGGRGEEVVRERERERERERGRERERERVDWGEDKRRSEFVKEGERECVRYSYRVRYMHTFL